VRYVILLHLLEVPIAAAEYFDIMSVLYLVGLQESTVRRSPKVVELYLL
jgi:hypothetical protein